MANSASSRSRNSFVKSQPSLSAAGCAWSTTACTSVVYFENGNIGYAASNLRTLRLREYLRKSELVSEDNLDDRVPDLELLKQLCAKNLVSAAAAEQVQTKQVADVLRLALLWTEGAWEFESRSRLEEQLNLKLDVGSLLLEAARRLPADFVVSRFRNPAEVITPLTDPLVNSNLLPAEVFLLSRLDQPMSLRDLVAVSGLGEKETLQLVYSLALAGVVQREHWKSVFRDQKPSQPPSCGTCRRHRQRRLLSASNLERSI